MSGGHYDYAYGRVRDLADSILGDAEKFVIEQENSFGDNIKPLPKECLDAMKLCGETLRLASQMAHDVEWYMSGDTGDDTFLERVKEWRKLENSK